MSNGTNDPTQGSGRASAADTTKQSEFYELLVKSNAEAAKLNELLVERSKVLANSAEMLASQTELQNKIATNYLNEITNLDSIISKQEKLRAYGRENQIDMVEAEELQRQIAKLDDDRIKALAEIEKRTEKIKELEKKSKDQGAKNLKEEERQFINLLKIKVDGENTLSHILTAKDKETGELLFTEKERRDALEKAKGINKDYLTLQTKITSLSGKAANFMGMTAQASDTFMGRSIETAIRLKQMTVAIGPKGMLKGMTNLIGQTFNFRNLMVNALENTAKIAYELDSASRALGASTGAGNIFGGQIYNIARAGNMAGIGVKEASAAIKAMQDNISTFNPTAAETNAYVGTTIARLEKLGVSSAAAAKSIDHMQRSMGLSAKAAADKTAQIARMGKTIGISGTKMIEQFNAASGRLAIYGKNNVKVFKELTAQAKATGIEMGTLLSISEKFDKFDTAAQSAAKLNAVLGTQLSHIEMLNATDSERIMMLKQQVQMSVGNFDSLDKYTKQYVAQAMGVKDVAEAQRLLNMSTAEYQKYQRGQKESADIQQEIADATEAAVPLMQQLELAFKQMFLAMSPLINFFTFVLPHVGTFMKGLIPILAIIALYFAYISIQTWSIAGAMSAIGWTLLVAAIMAAVYAIGWLVDEFTNLFDVFTLSGSPKLYDMPRYFAEGLGSMANGAIKAAKFVKNLALGPINWLYDAFHLSGSPMLWELPDFLAKSFIDMADSISNVFGEMTRFVEVMTNFASLDFKGFVAISSKGGSTSMIMGSEDVIASLSNGKLTVDVNMPEIAMPNIEVKVFIGDKQLREIIRTEVDKKIGRGG